MLLRLRDESPANRIRVLETILERYAEQLARHFIVATERGVRIRPVKSI